MTKLLAPAIKVDAKLLYLATVRSWYSGCLELLGSTFKLVVTAESCQLFGGARDGEVKRHWGWWQSDPASALLVFVGV